MKIQIKFSLQQTFGIWFSCEEKHSNLIQIWKRIFDFTFGLVNLKQIVAQTA